MSKDFEKLSDIRVDNVPDYDVIKRPVEGKEKSKKKGLYEDDIRRILEEKVLKYFDAYIHSSIFDVLAYKDEGVVGQYIIGFEIKSDHDNPMRFLEQLPQYVYICDAIYLVLGEKTTIPQNLPSWVGVLKVVNNDIKIIKLGGARLDLLMQGKRLYIHNINVRNVGHSLRGKMMHYMSKQVLPNYRKYTEYLPYPEFFYNFLRKWFILSVFKDFKDRINVKFDIAEIIMLEALANYFKTNAKQMFLSDY